MENVTSINNIYSGKKTIIFLINFISCMCDRVQVEFSALYGVLGLESENVRFQKWEIYFRSILDRASSVDFLEKRKIWNIQNIHFLSFHYLNLIIFNLSRLDILD